MRPTIRTFCIIWAVLAGILALALIIIASSMSATQENVVATLQQQGMTLEAAQKSVQETLTVLFVFGFVSLADAIYAGVLAFLCVHENLGFKPRLVLSIVALVMLVTVPGVLLLIDTILTKKGILNKPEDNKEEPESV